MLSSDLAVNVDGDYVGNRQTIQRLISFTANPPTLTSTGNLIKWTYVGEWGSVEDEGGKSGRRT